MGSLMKHLIYLLFIWISVNIIFGLIGLYALVLINDDSSNEISRIYDAETLCVFIFKILGLTSTVLCVYSFCVTENQVQISAIGFEFKSWRLIWQGLVLGTSPIILISLILYIRKDVDYTLTDLKGVNVVILFVTFILGDTNEEILTRVIY